MMSIGIIAYTISHHSQYSIPFLVPVKN